jgi:hypothetical protein
MNRICAALLAFGGMIAAASGMASSAWAVSGNEYRVSPLSPAVEQNFPAIASLAGGRFVVVWEEDGSIIAQLHRKFGVTKWRGPVDADSPGAQSNAHVTALANGDFLVVWENADASGQGVFGRRFDKDGKPVGAVFRANKTTAGNQTRTRAAGLPSGDWIIVWVSEGQDGDGTGIYGQLFAADGTRRGNEFRINTTTANNQTAPAVAAFPAADGGGFVVVWESHDGVGPFAINGQRFDADRQPVDLEFPVDSFGGGEPQSPRVATLGGGGGRFVVVWSSTDTVNPDFRIYGHVIGSGGSVAQFDVTSQSPFDKTVPDVAGFSDGGFVVVWQSEGQDGSGAGIYGQQYVGLAFPFNRIFRANQTTANDQSAPAVTTGGQFGQHFMIVWVSAGQDGSASGIYGRRLRRPQL